MALLEIDNLKTWFHTRNDALQDVTHNKHANHAKRHLARGEEVEHMEQPTQDEDPDADGDRIKDLAKSVVVLALDSTATVMFDRHVYDEDAETLS